jgi:Phosphotransferase enzyme family
MTATVGGPWTQDPYLRSSPDLTALLERPGMAAVQLAGSRDPNAKVTVALFDRFGPDLILKAPTTPAAEEVVRREGAVLAALRDRPLGALAGTVPRPLGHVSVGGLLSLVTTALPGTPMSVRYHAWRHTARPHTVRADFAAAGAWLARLQAATAGPAEPTTLLADALDACAGRFPQRAEALHRQLDMAAARLARHTTPRTVVHGDYWFGNLLVDRDQVVGVVDWESGELSGEPLRDVVRFAVSYALYLDRHTRSGRPVPGHKGLVACGWGAGLAHAVAGTGWFPDLVREYLGSALRRLGLPTDRWHDLLLAGIADVAATADHPDFAREHLDLLLRLAAFGQVERGKAEQAS